MRGNLWMERTKRRLLILISCCVLLGILLSLSISSTLLYPAFYHNIAEDEGMSASFDAAANMLPIDGAVTFNSRLLRDNFQSFMDGLIRYVTESDMSLSDISLENESSQSLRSAILSAKPDTDPEIPGISKIHPFVLTYFIPEAGNLYSLLQTGRTSYVAIRFLIPLSSIVLFVFLLFSKNTADNLRFSLILSGLMLMILALVLFLFRDILFISALKSKLPDWATVLEPFVTKTTEFFFIRCLCIGIPTVLIGFLFGCRLIRLACNKISGTLAMLLVVITFIFLVTYHNEIIIGATALTRFPKNQNIHLLNQNEETVHFLVLKLRTAEPEKPAAKVRLFLYGLDSSQRSIWMSGDSDTNGEVCFTIPPGHFSIYPDRTTIPKGYLPFCPVSIHIENPGSSSYTLHLPKDQEDNFNQKIQQKDLLPSDPPTP